MTVPPRVSPPLPAASEWVYKGSASRAMRRRAECARREVRRRQAGGVMAHSLRFRISCRAFLPPLRTECAGKGQSGGAIATHCEVMRPSLRSLNSRLSEWLWPAGWLCLSCKGPAPDIGERR
jgi:hypothetical protein